MLCTDRYLWFVPKVWNRQPAFPEIMRRHFRLAFSGEHALFVARDTHHTLTGLEICEVPHLLTDKGWELVHHFMIGLQTGHLILFGKHGGRCRSGSSSWVRAPLPCAGSSSPA